MAQRTNKNLGDQSGPKLISPKKIEITYGPSYSTFYSNNVGFSVNFLDFALTFGEAVDADEDRAILERRARVVMHPTQAKALMMLLMHNIQQYESINGEIPVPQAIIQRVAGTQ